MTERRGIRCGLFDLDGTLLDTAPDTGGALNRLRAASIVSGDTLPVRKPDPAPLQHAAASIGVAAHECVYPGDAERACADLDDFASWLRRDVLAGGLT
jgi:beta-phosphoglucomutase-like phosphatase (HAD superfamily)